MGSVGLLLAFWIVSPIFAFGKQRESRLLAEVQIDENPQLLGGLSFYAEYASLFPHRSGAEVVYLEQAYPRPRLLVSVSFAATIILTSLVPL